MQMIVAKRESGGIGSIRMMEMRCGEEGEVEIGSGQFIKYSPTSAGSTRDSEAVVCRLSRLPKGWAVQHDMS